MGFTEHELDIMCDCIRAGHKNAPKASIIEMAGFLYKTFAIYA